MLVGETHKINNQLGASTYSYVLANKPVIVGKGVYTCFFGRLEDSYLYQIKVTKSISEIVFYFLDV